MTGAEKFHKIRLQSAKEHARENVESMPEEHVEEYAERGLT
jgi:hypothetical protein